MPEPQRTDGGGTEGKDPVSSVSLNLMTRDYGAEEFNLSDYAHHARRNHQGCGAISHFMAPSRSSMWGSKALLGLKQNAGPQIQILEGHFS
ncbi:hypothetical protein O181_133806 [Austropuccinia psidii MF-1]|uniref:Uncharacterized protein n=1 Tax=Austropuccinia psidii MF-1 TaxID=1389203 RepID=A0A9Q3L7Z6_9BASI|nr:hypothetical protein [Austropuccinia psidii MF-1]